MKNTAKNKRTPNLKRHRLSAIVTPAYVQGAVSALPVGEALYPCRLPHTKKYLFPSPADSLWDKAICTSGVRLRMETDATSLTLHVDPLTAFNRDLIPGHAFDIVIDNKIIKTLCSSEGDTEVHFDKIGSGLRVLELWLPPSGPVGLKALTAEGASVLRPIPDRRPMWVTWGSSLTHCVRAGSASRIWPGTVSRKHNLNLMNMGFGGSCHLDPMVAMVIRDLPASYISMKLGINAVGQSLSARTYPPLVTAAVTIIREKQPHTPIVLASPLCSPPRESTPSATSYTLEGMRRDMEIVHRSLVENGDMNLYYVNGLELFGPEDIRKHTKDQLHPEAKGIDLQAQYFSRLVMPLLLGKAVS